MRLILDTNVLISALIQRGYPYLVIDHILGHNNLQLCISLPLLKEYVEVLNREKFSRYPDFFLQAKILIMDIQNMAVKFDPTISIDIIRDPSDNRLLELAEICKADYLVTGNSNDFTMKIYKKTRIVSPKEMFEIFNKRNL